MRIIKWNSAVPKWKKIKAGVKQKVTHPVWGADEINIYIRRDFFKTAREAQLPL